MPTIFYCIITLVIEAVRLDCNIFLNLTKSSVDISIFDMVGGFISTVTLFAEYNEHNYDNLIVISF